MPIDFVPPKQSSKVEKARAMESNGTITVVLDIHASKINGKIMKDGQKEKKN